MEKCLIGNGKSRSVELLAPAKDYDSVVAAVGLRRKYTW